MILSFIVYIGKLLSMTDVIEKSYEEEEWQHPWLYILDRCSMELNGTLPSHFGIHR